MGGGLFLVKSEDGRYMFIDTRKDCDKKGFSPMELMLIASAGCTSIDVVSMLNKMRIKYDDIKVSIEEVRRDEYPRIYKEVELTYEISGKDLDYNKIKKAVELSLSKYCSASITLKNAGAELKYEIKLNNK